ncbi:MAG: hypothetical protein HYV15_05810, partial [Elusimicrobia bacterium]|nr:hypothetical protein [Elusimicrobiota bacterium]
MSEILRDNPKAAGVLARHGVQVCAGCLVTLNSTPEKAAAYHAVRDLRLFLKDVER